MLDGTVYSGSHWQRYATAETDEAHDYIRRAFFDVKVRFAGGSRDGAGLRTITTRLTDIGVTRLHYSARTQVQTAPDGDLTTTHLMSGRFMIARNKDEYRLRPGDVVLMLPDQPQEAEFDDVDSFTTRLPRALLEEAAHAQTGISGADLRFDSSRPISAALGRHWTQTLSHLTRSVLCDPALMANPLVVGNTRHLLAATALAVFPNTAHGPALRAAGEVTPRALRRAVTYVDDHADQPITLDQVAAAAGVRPRALQLAFRRHHDTTPMRYVRQVRLERAHCDLQAGSPTTGVTVAMIATRWGFTHLGRFSTDYRAAYGCSPSHTLRT
ncbi:putative thc operon regulatory protein [Micromonospora noduli]|uniref:helix-turn-helix transcriptional regulator n=1 Tax=Micromonospora noduli TaxID=709876 RepID=UPI000DC3CF0C|nr:AraC family transcriptional regulator [Micromonospora noduli]RAO32843.1 putative thc operon regulatory protein [Micromonospora noduli]